MTAADLFGQAAEIIGEALISPVRTAVANGTAVFACCLLSALGAGWEGKDAAVRLASVLAVAAVSLSGVRSLIGSAGEALEELTLLSGTLIPTLASALASTGHAGTAGAGTAAFMLFSDLIAALEKSVIMPLVYAYLAVSIGHAAFGGGLGGLKSAIKWAVNTLVTLLATGYILALKAASAIASSADAAAVKLTKAAISNLVPVVGRVVSDAAESVASGMVLVKNSAGAAGLIAIITLTAGPVLTAAANYIALKLASALAEPISGGAAAGLASDVATAMGWSVACCALAALGLFLAVVTALEVSV